jgi:glucose-6-phosphate dehydrogenase assembly protein OpcA
VSAFFDPVEIERKIDECLAVTGAAVKRASLLTLVVVHPRESQSSVAARLDYLFGKRPLRVIRVETGHSAPTSVDVSARCLPQPAGDEICFQEIVFYDGPDGRGLDGAFWSPLVIRDLPVALAWLLEPAGLVAFLDRSGFAVDKCLVDLLTASGRDSAALLETLALLGRRFGPVAAGPAPPPLADFAWRSLAPLRARIARLFDPPAARPLLGRLAQVEFAGLPAVSAVLLALWLAARLGWTRQRLAAGGFACADPVGNDVAVRLPAERSAGGEEPFSIGFTTARGESLGLGCAAGEEEKFTPVCGEECLLAEIDHLGPDPAYGEVLAAAAGFSSGAGRS